MVNIETVTEYRFTRPTGQRVNVRVLFDNDTQYVTHEYDADDIENGHIHGNWWLDGLSVKPREQLQKCNRDLYDFLKARIEQ